MSSRTRAVIYSHEQPKEPTYEVIEPAFEGNVAVLVITSHGDIQVEYDVDDPAEPKFAVVDPRRFKIPKDMEIVGLEVVPPTVPNLLPSTSVRPFVNIIKEETSGFNSKTKADEMMAMVERIKNRIREQDEEPAGALKEFRKKGSEFETDAELRSYVHHLDLFYRTFNYKKVDPYDKRFLREEYLVTDNTKSPKYYDWKLNIINSDPELDLMAELNPIVTTLRSKRTRTSFTITNLRDMIAFLRSKGIRKIIMIDLSCSVIRDVDRGVLPTAERYTLHLDRRRTRGHGGRKHVRRNKTVKRKRTIN